MNKLTTTQQQKLVEIMQNLLPNQSVTGWGDETALLGEIAEFDSMLLANLLAALEAGFEISVDDQQLEAEDFASWGCLQLLVVRLVGSRVHG